MKVILYKRRYGVHRFVKECEVPVSFNKVYIKEDVINEDLLLNLLPKNWLPVEPREILLTISDKEGCGTGQRGLNRFLPWAKYFDSYVIELQED